MRFERLTSLRYDAASGLYTIYARTGLDRTDEGGGTGFWLDGRTGKVMRLLPPGNGGSSRADGFINWLEWLHMAEVFGLPWKIVVSAAGLLTTGLTVTGVLVWTRKRSSRLLVQNRHARMSTTREAIPA